MTDREINYIQTEINMREAEIVKLQFEVDTFKRIMKRLE